MTRHTQVDMYSVGLGAALLVQHRRPNVEVVRILADGGMGSGTIYVGAQWSHGPVESIRPCFLACDV